MATFKAGQENHYGGSGGAGFFSIQQDGGVKQVRILYNTIDDVEGVSVHKIKLNGRNRYVNCLRNYNDPKDACPFCKDGRPVEARLIIPVYNIEEDQVQLWDRGKTMFPEISSLCARYGSNGKTLVSTIFEIERHGGYGDKKTVYKIFPVESDNAKLEDFPINEDAYSKLVLDKTYEEMESFLASGNFPGYEDNSNSDHSSNNDQQEMPIRRRGSADRRTPSNRGEVF